MIFKLLKERDLNGITRHYLYTLIIIYLNLTTPLTYSMDKEKWVQFPPRAVTLNVDLQPKQEDFTEKSPSTSLGVQSQEETIKNDQLNNIKSKANENPSRFHIHYGLDPVTQYRRYV